MRCRLISLGALVLLTAGCTADQSSLFGEDVGTIDPEQELRFASADGRGVLTEIHGRAFDLSQDEFDRLVLASMQGANAGTPARFTSEPGPEDRTAYRVVLQFNGSPYDQSNRLCKDGGGRDSGAAPSTRVSAAFCIDHSMISAINGEVGAALAADNPQFRDLVRQVVFRLFVIRPNNTQDDGDFPVPPS